MKRIPCAQLMTTKLTTCSCRHHLGIVLRFLFSHCEYRTQKKFHRQQQSRCRTRRENTYHGYYSRHFSNPINYSEPGKDGEANNGAGENSDCIAVRVYLRARPQRLLVTLIYVHEVKNSLKTLIFPVNSREIPNDPYYHYGLRVIQIKTSRLKKRRTIYGDVSTRGKGNLWNMLSSGIIGRKIQIHIANSLTLTLK